MKSIGRNLFLLVLCWIAGIPYFQNLDKRDLTVYEFSCWYRPLKKLNFFTLFHNNLPTLLAECGNIFYYCCDWKAQASCAQSFTLWQQATIEIMHRDHSLITCSRHLYMGVVLYTHSVRGEPCIQCNASQEFATTSLPFYNEPHRSHVLFVKASHSTTFTSWSQHHFVAIGNA